MLGWEWVQSAKKPRTLPQNRQVTKVLGTVAPADAALPAPGVSVSE